MPAKKPKNSRRKPSQSRSRETVDAILEATAQILSRQGYAACSTNQIAEKAGVSIGGLYQYFKDKQAILRELCIREVQKDVTAIEQCLEKMAGAPIEQITPALISVALERFSDRPRLRQILMHESPTGRPEQDLRVMRKHLADLLTGYLKTYSQLKIHADMQLEVLILVSAVEAAISAALLEYGPRLDKPRLVEGVSEMVLRYLSKFT